RAIRRAHPGAAAAGRDRIRGRRHRHHGRSEDLRCAPDVGCGRDARMTVRSDDAGDEAQASVRRTWFSWFWVAPLFATAVVAWLGWRTLAERGPAITIMFKTADGLQEGQTNIRHKGNDVGTI